MSLMKMKGIMMPPPVDQDVAPENRRRIGGTELDSSKRQGDDATITRALKITAESTALSDCAVA